MSNPEYNDEGVDFFEDPGKYKPTPVVNQIKGKSIEAWFYKKFPGKISIKRFFLILFAVILFGLSIRFMLLAYLNSSQERIKQDFEERVRNTRLK